MHFLDAQASLAPSPVCLSVRPSVRQLVRHTFGFPLPLNISVQQSSLMSMSYFIKLKACVRMCVHACVRACVVSESVFFKSVFWKDIF